MTQRAAARIAIAALLFVVLAATVSIWLAVAGGSLHQSGDDLVFAVIVLMYPLVGAAIVSRRPENPIGWLLLGFGITASITTLPTEYAGYALATGRDLPAYEWAAWVSDWLGASGAPLLLGFTFLLFPTGRPPSSRWRWVGYVIALGAMVNAFTIAFTPGRIPSMPIENPAGLPPLAGAIAVLGPIAGILTVASLLLPVISLFARRKTSPVERQQLKWIAFAAGLLVAAVALGITADALGLGAEEDSIDLAALIVFGIPITALPLAIGAAVLRYRLYDIDLVINRTIVYGLLTALLIGAYVVMIGLLQFLLPIQGDDQLTVAASTLAVAAIFDPARRRLQSGIDHLFYRRRYDAQRTLEEFSRRLRDEVDLGTLTDELVRVIGATMHPQHISIWVRRPEEASS